MKILKNNFTEKREISCPECKSELLISNDDICKASDSEYVVCPCCNSKIILSGTMPYECPECGKDFCGTPYIGSQGCYFVRCPHCKEEVLLDGGIEITPESINYPTHFYSYEHGKEIKEDVLNQWVKECVNRLSKDADYAYSGSGDSIVFAYKSDLDLNLATVVVARKYSECDVTIPPERY